MGLDVGMCNAEATAAATTSLLLLLPELPRSLNKLFFFNSKGAGDGGDKDEPCKVGVRLVSISEWAEMSSRRIAAKLSVVPDDLLDNITERSINTRYS